MKKTVNMKRLGATELNDLRVAFLPGFDVAALTNGAVVDYPKDVQRPLTRGDCVDGERPCPWVSCRYHLALDASEDRDSLKVNFPVRLGKDENGKEQFDFTDVDLDAMKFTCALDVAALADELSIEELAEAMGLSYDRCFQVCDEAKKRAHEIAAEIGAAEGMPVRPTARKQAQADAVRCDQVSTNPEKDVPLVGDAMPRATANDNQEDPESNEE